MEHKITVWKNFLLPYKFALDELRTKVNIMVEETKYMEEDSLIEHVKTRLKTPQSMMDKLERKGIEPTVANAKANLFDVAGMRIVTPFKSDVYHLYELMMNRNDLKIMEVKDYIRFPKANGYQSMHLIVQVPITLSKGMEHVYVEVQIRTLAMDFWASLEHKIYYKYQSDIPQYLEKGLKEAADTVKEMDEKMKVIHDAVEGLHETSTKKVISLHSDGGRTK
ncbi:GTP pyrophosphokinase [Salipaludibacillus daqingensis]|uniref:GTP pyrophosphokinase n=1 Tax=Salipaludibacillus daqingensis TaxID=3041001 RepID=UPI002472EA4A|nr:GTP pyrophosphokinase family protein [Salipaludibacillus daqingensis]